MMKENRQPLFHGFNEREAVKTYLLSLTLFDRYYLTLFGSGG